MYPSEMLIKAVIRYGAILPYFENNSIATFDKIQMELVIHHALGDFQFFNNYIYLLCSK